MTARRPRALRAGSRRARPLHRLDYDFHVVDIEGEPQLWRIDASGPMVDQLALVRQGADIACPEPGL